MNKHNLKLTFMKALLMFGCIPMLIATIITAVVASMDMKESMEESAFERLDVAAIGEREYFEYDIDEGILSQDEESEAFVDSMKENGIELTLFEKNTRYETSILNDAGKRNIGTNCDDEIWAQVSKGESYHSDGVNIAGKEYYVSYLPIYATNEDGVKTVWGMAFAGEPSEKVTSKISSVVIKIAIIATIIAVIFIAIIVLLARKIKQSAEESAKAVKKLSSGDIRSKVECKSSISELQEIIESTSDLQHNLEEIINNVKDSSESVNSSAITVADMATVSAESCNQVNQAVDELAQGSLSIAESCTAMAHEVDTMSQCCDDISDEVSNLTNASQEIQKANDEAKSYMNTALTASEKSTISANEIADIIMETNDSVKEINKAIDLILSIASQTNLLSLNASIEAARAGEAGRGFAVVASEISNLAAQSSESASVIQTIVQAITEKSTKSVEHAKEIKEIIAEQQTCINDTNEKFEVLSHQVDNSIESIKAISSKVEELAKVKNVINANVSDLSAVSQESAASTQESTANIASISQSVNDISDNSNDLKNLAEQLAEQVSFFK